MSYPSKSEVYNQNPNPNFNQNPYPSMSSVGQSQKAPISV